MGKKTKQFQKEKIKYTNSDNEREEEDLLFLTKSNFN